MKSMILENLIQPSPGLRAPAREGRSAIWTRTGGGDLWMIVVLTLLLSGLAHAGYANALTLSPAALRGGEIWRWLTHPFVHISVYHLALDLTAFGSLYLMLGFSSARDRLAAAATCATGSAALSMMHPSFAEYGLCGLSGAGHGLIVLAGLHLSQPENNASLRRMGAWTVGLVLCKSVWEAVTGHVLFESLHLGSVGHPMTFSHLGGVLGGLLFYGGHALRARFSTRRAP